MKVIIRLLIRTVTLSSAAQAENLDDRHTLPLSKVNLEPCHNKTLRLHSGVISKRQLLHWHGGFWVRFERQTPEDEQWFVRCDLASGKVIHEQKLIR